MKAKKPNPYLDFVLEQLAPLGEITARSMMGGQVLYCDGTVFALIANSTLYLKADEANRPAFAARGIEPFRPFPDKEGVMHYYPAPPEIFEDRDALLEWVRPAVEAGQRAAVKKRPARKRASPMD